MQLTLTVSLEHDAWLFILDFQPIPDPVTCSVCNGY